MIRALLLVALLALGACHQANAQARRIGFPPTYRPGLFPAVSGAFVLTGDCAKAAPAGLTMTACYDFKNGSYTSDGVTPAASFVAAGGSLGTCSVTAGSGLGGCTGAGATITANNPATGDFLVSSYAGAASGTQAAAFLGVSNSIGLNEYTQSGARGLQIGTATPLTTATLNTQGAICVSAAGAGYLAFGGNTASSASSSTPPANTTLTIGNNPGGTYPMGAGNYVASVRLFTGTCNGTNVQAASGN